MKKKTKAKKIKPMVMTITVNSTTGECRRKLNGQCAAEHGLAALAQTTNDYFSALIERGYRFGDLSGIFLTKLVGDRRWVEYVNRKA